MHSIYNISKNLSPAKRNYTTIEKKFLVVVYAINKFRHYIIGYKTFIHIDHATIHYLMNKVVVGGCIIRWLLFLQEFDITIVNKLGKDNFVADFLSGMVLQGNDEAVNDAFPDEHLFSISVQAPWFADIANYLVTRKCPNHFNPKQKKQLVRESSRFQWVDGLLFKMCLDHVLCRCVQEIDVYDIIYSCHNEPEGGHYSTIRIVHKILGEGYFWSSMTKYVFHFM